LKARRISELAASWRSSTRCTVLWPPAPLSRRPSGSRPAGRLRARISPKRLASVCRSLWARCGTEQSARPPPGIAATHQRRGHSPVVDGKFEHRPVDMPGREPRPDLRHQHVQAFGHEAASLAHAGNRRLMKLDPCQSDRRAPPVIGAASARQDVAGTVGILDPRPGSDSRGVGQDFKNFQKSFYKSDALPWSIVE
jgi:hypothetical protein